MRKLKIYLDTSVISHLFAEDTPERMQETLDFWNDIKSGKYEVIISDIVLEEINNAGDKRKFKMLEKLKEIKIKSKPLTDEIEDLAEFIIEQGILSHKSLYDCYHIATAITEECHIIVSWNFKHIVRRKTINGIKEVIISKEYRPIEIYSPVMLLEKED